MPHRVFGKLLAAPHCGKKTLCRIATLYQAVATAPFCQDRGILIFDGLAKINTSYI